MNKCTVATLSIFLMQCYLCSRISAATDRSRQNPLTLFRCSSRWRVVAHWSQAAFSAHHLLQPWSVLQFFNLLFILNPTCPWQSILGCSPIIRFRGRMHLPGNRSGTRISIKESITMKKRQGTLTRSSSNPTVIFCKPWEYSSLRIYLNLLIGVVWATTLLDSCRTLRSRPLLSVLQDRHLAGLSKEK